jgi:hypothetical protein
MHVRQLFAPTKTMQDSFYLRALRNDMHRICEVARSASSQTFMIYDSPFTNFRCLLFALSIYDLLFTIYESRCLLFAVHFFRPECSRTSASFAAGAALDGLRGLV